MVLQPNKIDLVEGEELVDIQGGEHHTLFLMKSGKIFGAGRNDDGQLGQCVPTEIGTLQELTHIHNVTKIFCSSHFNYAFK